MTKEQWLAKLHVLAFEDTRLDRIPFTCFEALAEGIANIEEAEKNKQWNETVGEIIREPFRRPTKRAVDGDYCTCPPSVPRYDAGDGWKCHWCHRPRP